jgi:hypothetical protein
LNISMPGGMSGYEDYNQCSKGSYSKAFKTPQG